ncbi:MAG: hypothetical protein ACRBG0_21655 [Lewinella sp.]|uniref:hypothetical protein n=1 Tax=Lewinella sp. TaxID=2004506 RepID=UPI003D6C4B64
MEAELNTSQTDHRLKQVHLWGKYLPFLLFGSAILAYFFTAKAENYLSVILFLCLTILLMVLVSEKVAKTIQKATEAGVTIVNVPANTKADWSALFFAMAIFIWAFKLFIFTLLPDYELTQQVEGKYTTPYLVDALLSILNSIFFLLAAANIHLKSTTLPSVSGLRWFTGPIMKLGIYNRMLWIKKKIAESSPRYLAAVLFITIITPTIFLWGYGHYTDTKITYNWTYLFDSIFAIFLTVFLTVIFFAAFLERGYSILSWLVSLVLPFVLFATITKGFMSYDIFQSYPLKWSNNETLSKINLLEISGGIGSSYKFIFVPLVLMLSITFFAMIQRVTADKVLVQRDKLDEQNQALEAAQGELSHRLKNDYLVTSRRVNAFARNERYVNEPLATEALGKAVALIDASLMLYNYMELESDVDRVSISSYVSELMRLAWIRSFGHHETELTIDMANFDVKLTMRKLKVRMLAQLILEILFNITEHAYKDVPHDLGQRVVHLKGENDKELVTLTIIDQGPGFTGGYQKKSVSYGSKIIVDNVKKLKGQLSYDYHYEEAPRGTKMIISFPALD